MREHYYYVQIGVRCSLPTHHRAGQKDSLRLRKAQALQVFNGGSRVGAAQLEN